MPIYKSMEEVSEAIDRIVEQRAKDVVKVECVDAKTAARRIRKFVKQGGDVCYWNDIQLNQMEAINRRLVKKDWSVTRRAIVDPPKPKRQFGQIRMSAWPKRQYVIEYVSPCKQYNLKIIGYSDICGGQVSVHLVRMKEVRDGQRK